MLFDNNARRIKREVLFRLAELQFEGRLETEIDRIPFDMIPHHKTPNRCCVHKDRAVIKTRAMAGLGMLTEEETEEWKPLSAYARKALDRTEPQGPILTLLQEACTGCTKNSYFVSNACRGCVARPCTSVCPKKAVSMQNNRALIDADKCINCGLCEKNCPYHAIVYTPVPCEESCPVGALGKDEQGHEVIDFEKCIYCGRCLRSCPFGAVMERSQMTDVIKAITTGRHVAALVAPALEGQFPAAYPQVLSALLALGFTSVHEVARGAEVTIANEAAEWLEKAGPTGFLTTSCCPSYTMAAEKAMKPLAPFVSHTQTPLFYTARQVKKELPAAYTVFISPCIGKRAEGMANPAVNAVITFEELGAMLMGRKLEVQAMEPLPGYNPASSGARGFAAAGGVAGAVAYALGPDSGLKSLSVHSLSKQSMKELVIHAREDRTINFLEVMACEGGCIAGPCVLANPRMAAKKMQEALKEK